MKYLLCNLTWGRGSLGDEAILAGLLTQYNKKDVTVGSYDPEETHEIFNLTSVNETETVNVDTLVVGGGYILPSSVDGLNELVGRYKKEGSRIEIRAVQFNENDEATLKLLCKADYVSVRQQALAKKLSMNFEPDFAFDCPTQKWKHTYHGWVGYNAFRIGGGGTIKESGTVSLPKGKVVGVASVRHKCDEREDDFVALKEKNCDAYYHDVNPMKVKYLLSTLRCMYSQRKHLALLAYTAGTPTYYFGKTEANRQLVQEWGVPTI